MNESNDEIAMFAHVRKLEQPRQTSSGLPGRHKLVFESVWLKNIASQPALLRRVGQSVSQYAGICIRRCQEEHLRTTHCPRSVISMDRQIVWMRLKTGRCSNSWMYRATHHKNQCCRYNARARAGAHSRAYTSVHPPVCWNSPS